MTFDSINRPGGHGKITKLHYGTTSTDGTTTPTGVVTAVDVKYTITGGFDRQLDVQFVEPWQELDRTNRRATSAAVTLPTRDGAVQPPRRKTTTTTASKRSKGAATTGLALHPAHPDDKENNHRRLPGGPMAPPPPRRRASNNAPPAVALPTKKKPIFAAAFPGRNRATTHSSKPQAKATARQGARPPQPTSTSRNLTTRDSSSASLGSSSVPFLIYADDEQSLVSELDAYGGGVEERRSPSSSSLLPPRHHQRQQHRQHPHHHDSTSGGGRQRRHTLESTTAASSHGDTSSSGQRSSPCSNARKIASGQVLLAVAAASAPPPAVSPRFTKSLVVGRVADAAPPGGNDDPATMGCHPRTMPVTLRQVYQSERRWASEFVQDVVVLLDRRDDDDHPMTAAEDDDQDDVMSVASSAGPDTHHNGGLRAAAVACLVSAALADKDGALDETEALDPQAYPPQDPPLTVAELQACVKHLSDANKLMRSDGQLYRI